MKRIFIEYFLNTVVASSIALWALWALCAPAIEPRIGKNIMNEKGSLAIVPDGGIIDTTSTTISWNPPSEDLKTVAYYKLYYRPVINPQWTLIDSTIPATLTPKKVVARSLLSANDSLFYFGVQYIAPDGRISEIHSTADSSAIPAGGWYLLWRMKK